MTNKTKKVLIVHYSQTGQLSDVAKSFSAPLVNHPEIDVTFECIEPVKPYSFPWPFFRFFDTFPEAVYQDPDPIKPSALKGDEDFDLIILAYQVWFLSPSLPVTAFLQSNVAAKLFKNKPVVTLIACRNMWLMAQEAIKENLNKLDAALVGNVALVDEAGSAGSFLATPVWVLSGKRGPHLGGLIPRAGVSPKHITDCKRFGERIVERMAEGDELNTGLLQGLDAVEVNEKLIASEAAAKRGFRIWGKLLRSLGKQGAWQRKPILCFYIIFLLTLILTFIPISVLLQTVFEPLLRKRLAEKKAYFLRPSGLVDELK